MLEKRFSKGLQFQAAYTFSRSIDQASSFEETLDPFSFDSSRALSLFNSAQRFVISYFWDLPIPKHSGWMGKLVNDWAVSGITSFQSGFPIRLSNDSINASSDTELINSFFFVGTEAPQRVAPFTTLNPKRPMAAIGSTVPILPVHPWVSSIPARSVRSAADPGSTIPTLPCTNRLQSPKASISNSVEKYSTLPITPNLRNPDGNLGDGALFGKITSARDPRLVQFALKLFF